MVRSGDRAGGLARFFRMLPLILFFLLAITGMFWVQAQYQPVREGAQAVRIAQAGSRHVAPFTKIVPERPVLQRLVQSSAPIRIGLVVGHLNNDSGAVCEDGLMEVQVNLGIVERVAERLAAAGITTEIMAEFDSRLQGYDGTALVSVHADSCADINEQASGFKIAASAAPASAALENCLEQAYREATGLSYHANTITPHMTDYHAFREIDPGTPAVIVEVGFMFQDRQLLTETPERPATGLSTGLLCFLENAS